MPHRPKAAHVQPRHRPSLATLTPNLEVVLLKRNTIPLTPLVRLVATLGSDMSCRHSVIRITSGVPFASWGTLRRLSRADRRRAVTDPVEEKGRTMDVGGVGAIGAGAAMGAAATGSNLGATAAGTSAQGAEGTASGAGQTIGNQVPTTVEQLNEILSAGIPGSVEQLAELADDLSSAEILFALILMAAMQKKDDDEGGGAGALGLLAGIALAAELGRSIEFNFGGAATQVSGAEGAAGGQLNLQA